MTIDTPVKSKSGILKILSEISGFFYHLGVISVIVAVLLFLAFFHFHHELNCAKGAIVTTLQFGNVILTLPCEGTTISTAALEYIQ